ncbi:MAG: hypothetical protein K1X67_16045, partial [Fimbriimonadaceae bacterium]|nr:hypothetical protein [Fimbriimonadaceae bacterium]
DSSFVDTCIVNPAWRDAIGPLLASPFGKGAHGFAKAEWEQIATQLERLEQSGLKAPFEEAAVAYFSAGRYADAVRCWDDAGNTRDGRYAQAKAYSEPYPKNVPALGSLKLWKMIVDAYDANKGAALSADQATWVLSALIQEGRSGEAFEVAWASKGSEPLLQVALAARQKDPLMAARVLHAGFASLVANKKWDLFASYLSTAGFRPTPEWSDPSAAEWLNEHKSDLDLTLLRAFAREGDLGSAPESVQRRWSEFLKSVVRDIGGEWRSRVTVEEAGAAFERTGRLTDGIWFYEQLRRGGKSESERSFASRRWIVCKNRHLQYEKSQRESGKTRQSERELKQAMAKQGISSVEMLGSYPTLGPLDLALPAGAATTVVPATTLEPKQRTGGSAALTRGLRTVMGHQDEEPVAIDTVNTPIDSPARMGEEESEAATAGRRPDRFKMTMGDFEFELSRQLARLSVKNDVTMDTISIKVAAKQVSGDVAVLGNGDDGWSIASWGMSVRLLGESAVAVSVDSLGVELKFTV